ncbi:extended synaptotagmin-1-like, partial [Tropilaelaps mercedesae]
ETGSGLVDFLGLRKAIYKRCDGFSPAPASTAPLRKAFLKLVDFTLTNIGEIMEIPGVNDLLKKAVSDQISQVLVLPNKYTYRVIESVSAHTLKYSLPAGVLRIQVIEAAKLVKADIGMLGMGKSDPYAVLTIGKIEFRTQVIPSTITPRWDFSCEAVVHQLPGSVLDIEVYDEDQSSKDDFLGKTSLSIPDLAEKATADMWLKLEAVKSGQIHIRTEWVTLSSDPASLERELEYKRSLTTNHQHSVGLIAVFLDCASALPRKQSAHTRAELQISSSDELYGGSVKGVQRQNHGLVGNVLAPFQKLAKDVTQVVQGRSGGRKVGITAVTLKEARTFPVGLKAAEPSCQVVLSVDKEEQRSSVVANSVNPVWEETFTFLCANPDVGEFCARVLDTKSGQCVGSATVSTARLLREGDMRLDEPLALKGTNNAKLMLSLQLRILQSTGSTIGAPGRCATPAYSRSSSEQRGEHAESGSSGYQHPSTPTSGSGGAGSGATVPVTPRKTEIPSMDEMVHSTISPILETIHGSRQNAQPPNFPNKYVADVKSKRHAEDAEESHKAVVERDEANIAEKPVNDNKSDRVDRTSDNERTVKIARKEVSGCGLARLGARTREGGARYQALWVDNAKELTLRCPVFCSPSLSCLSKSSTWNTQMRVTLRYSPPRNRLVCVIHQVKDLPPAIVVGEDEEVYVKVQLAPCDTSKHKENRHKTRPIRATSTGVVDFDETVELDVAPHELCLVSLQFQLRCRSTKRPSVFNVNKRIMNMNHSNAKRKLLGQLTLSLDQLDGVAALTEW